MENMLRNFREKEKTESLMEKMRRFYILGEENLCGKSQFFKDTEKSERRREKVSVKKMPSKVTRQYSGFIVETPTRLVSFPES